MSTYKILSNVLDFIDKKNDEQNAHKSPDDEEIEVHHNGVAWVKSYPKIEVPQEEGAEIKKSRLEMDPQDKVAYRFDYYYDSDRKTWTRSLEINIWSKTDHKNASIPIYWWNRYHPTLIRAWAMFYKIERDCTRFEMLEMDKQLAKVDPNRIDNILQGVVDGNEKVAEE